MEIIRIEIESKNKKYNLSGEGSIFGGIDIYKHILLGYVVPSTNPLIRLNLKFISLVRDKNILRLKRVNGRPYDIHKTIAIVLSIIMAIISSYQILSYGFAKNIAYSIMPIFGIGYFLIIEIFAKISYKNLCRNIETIMDKEGITYAKL